MRKDKPMQIGVWLSSEEVTRLDAAAKAQRNTRSGILRLALDRFLAAVEAQG